ncbi:MAG: hypothetical protein K2L02_06340, partial [Clostridia bacterium]|nr:hypothetical protein [Clostridia bacterium]
MCCGFFAAKNTKTADALKSTTINSATKAGGGENLWDGEDFNGEVMDDLLEKLFGDEDPVEYIRENGAADYNNYGKNSPLVDDSPYKGVPYYVVPASTINANPRIKNTNYGMTVNLGTDLNGDPLTWMATSLTLADTPEEEDNVILTLLLANLNNIDGYKSVFCSNTSTGCNVYSKSTLRFNLLNNANLKLFSQGSDDESFAKQFLVQPKYITYQQTEDLNGRDSRFQKRTGLNEALGELSTSTYKPSAMVGGYRYDAWGEDYVWIPSASELGASDILTTGCIWRLANNQRLIDCNYWVRTNDDSISMMPFISANNGYYGQGNKVSNSLYYIPAIHLNLSAAALGTSGTKLKNPENVENTYNGEEQTIKSIYEENAKKAKWYAPKSYEHENEYVKMTYPEGGTIEAGEYWVKVELQQNWFDDVAAAVAAEAVEKGWTEEETAIAQERKKPKFRGDPDTSDPDHLETDRVRWFKLTIPKKKIAVSFTYDTSGYPSVDWSEDIYQYDIDNDKVPELGLSYAYSKSSDGTLEDPYTFPEPLGKYKATAYIIDEETGNYNYEIDTEKSFVSDEFEVKPRKIADPVLTSGGIKKSVAYNGNPQSITLQNIDETDVSYLVSDGLTEDSYSGGVLTVSATAIGMNYTVTVSLARPDITVWQSGGTTAKQFTLEITQATLTATINGLPSSWGQGIAQEVTVSVDGLIGEDAVQLYAFYKADGGSEISVTEVDGVYSIPADLTQGSYVFGVRLADTDGNYIMAAKTQNFTVTPPNASFTEADIAWQYTISGGAPQYIPTGAGTAGSPYEVDYANANYQFTLTMDSSALAAKGVKASYTGNTSAKNACESLYHVTVTITAKDSQVTYATTVHDFYFKINKVKFDLSNVQWNYDAANPLQYTGSQQTVTLKAGTIPAGLTPSYVKNGPSAINNIAVGNYSLRVAFNVSDTTNYVEPVYDDATSYEGDFEWVCNWEIVRKKITVSWKDNQQEDENGVLIFVPKLSTNGDLVEYSYEKMNEQGNYEPCGFPEYVEGTEMQYRVTVALKSAYTASYELDGNPTREFTVGKDKYPVHVQLKVNGKVLEDDAEFPYNGSAYSAVVEIVDGYVQLSEFSITYYDGNNVALSSAPVNVGTYKAVVTMSLTAQDENVLSGQTEFTFSITAGVFDTSGLVWQYSHGDFVATYDAAHGKWVDSDGKEITSFVYDGNEHAFTLVGKEELEAQAGMTSVTLSNDTATNAGPYTLAVVFNYDSDNYNAPVFAASSIPYTILKGEIVTDNVKWGYIGADGEEHEITANTVLEYMRENGAAKDYVFLLINLPEQLEGKVSYKLNGQNGNAVSGVGTYFVSYTVSGVDTDNYEPLVMPAALENNKLVEIVARDLGKPTFDGSWTEFNFLDTPKNLLELCGMDADGLDVYYTATVKLNGKTYDGYDGEAFNAYHAGEYVVVFDVIKINGESGNNVTFGGTVRTQEVEFTIKKQTFTVTGWNGDEETSQAKFDITGAAAVVGTQIVDEEGTVYTEDDFYNAPAGNLFYAVPYVKEGYEGDIEIVIKPGVAQRIEFSSYFEINSDTVFVAKPSFETASIEYDGNEHTFVLNGLDGFEEYIHITEGDELAQTN